MQTHRDGDEVGMEPSEVLRTKDLAIEEPRPMDEELAGYAWLPRMIDKARAYGAGTLGDLVHPCPVDRNALRLLGIEPVAFREIACSAQTAGDVLAGLRSAGARSAEEAWFDAPAFEEALVNGSHAETA
jgi:hypothetical protein